MTVIIGYIVVFGSILGGFMLAGGNPLLLLQPSEFIIIGGAALGSLIIASPSPILKLVTAGFKSFLGGKRPQGKTE